MDPQTPTEAPPPAYEAEHDFDRKISDALERSNQLQQQSSFSPDDDEWEEWDEARFEAAAALARSREQRQENEQPGLPIPQPSSEKERLASRDAWQPDHRSGEASSSTSSGSVVQPSRRLPACPPAKERPSWYSEAQLDTSASSGSSQNNNLVSPPHLVHDLPPEENLPTEQLPPFAPVGPSLEGPPFEEVVRQPPRLLPASSIDSPPQSPLDSVDSDTLPDPPSFHESSSWRGYGEHSQLTSPRQSLAPPMPRTQPVPPPSHRPPPMRFDPSVAYAKHRNVNMSLSEPEPVDASAFYNSAVSSHFISSRTNSRIIRPAIPAMSPTHRGPSINVSHPMHNQGFVPNPHPPQPRPQQPQQVVPNLYGHHFLGPVPGLPLATTPPPNRPPSTNNPGGYRR